MRWKNVNNRVRLKRIRVCLKMSHLSFVNLDPDPRWEKQLDPNWQKMNADPQPFLAVVIQILMAVNVAWFIIFLTLTPRDFDGFF